MNDAPRSEQIPHVVHRYPKHIRVPEEMSKEFAGVVTVTSCTSVYEDGVSELDPGTTESAESAFG